MTSPALNRPADVREQFEAAVRQWPNYSERTLARDGRYPEYYGNPVVQGAWEGWKAAMRSPTVVELIAAGDFMAMNATRGMLLRWERVKSAVAAPGQRGCDVCGGDCAGANPPVYNCPMRDGGRP